MGHRTQKFPYDKNLKNFGNLRPRKWHFWDPKLRTHEIPNIVLYNLHIKSPHFPTRTGGTLWKNKYLKKKGRFISKKREMFLKKKANLLKKKAGCFPLTSYGISYRHFRLHVPPNSCRFSHNFIADVNCWDLVWVRVGPIFESMLGWYPEMDNLKDF